MKTRNADISGQLLTQKALEDVITKVGNANEIKYSVWSDTTLHTEVRTLKDIAEDPFVSNDYHLEARNFS